jgi:phosphoenolpyruvate---glycerone phosphotransferase subunit DhaL
MPKSALTAQDILAALDLMCADLEEKKEELRELDARIGDGDLGITMELGCRSLREGLPALADADIGTILARSGMNFTKSAASTFGILMASLLMGAGKSVMKQRSVDLADLARMAGGAETGVRNRGKADVGDKTLLDSLVPAVNAVKEAARLQKSIPEALDAAVKAAEEGMKSTIPMKSKQGRARWQGERTVGVQDAGATAIYLMIDSCVRHLKDILTREPS